MISSKYSSYISGFHSGGGSSNNTTKPVPSKTMEIEKLEDTRVNSGKTEFNVPYIKKVGKKLNGMYGLSPYLPLSFSKEGSYNLLVELRDVVKQNLKNLILTEPGERIMDNNFGVGLKSLLFENNTTSTRTSIENRIRQKTALYMPYVSIQEIEFDTDDNDLNYLGISIYYSVQNLSISDTLSLAIGE